MAVTLQFLLMLLPFLIRNDSSSDSVEYLDWMEEHLDLEFNDGGENVGMTPVKVPELYKDPNFEMIMGITETGEPYKKMQRGVKPIGPNPVLCYKNIKILMTEECSRFQPIDFSDVKINDFCIGDYVQFGGSITIFYTIYHPFVIYTNVTRVDNLSENRYDEYDEQVANFGRASPFYKLETNGCDFFGILFCSITREPWCGCPLPWGKAPLFRARILATADFLPKALGTGTFFGRSHFEYSKGKVCLEFTFDRVVGKIARN